LNGFCTNNERGGLEGSDDGPGDDGEGSRGSLRGIDPSFTRIVGGFRIEFNKANTFRLSRPSRAIQKLTTEPLETINFPSPFTS
jgi:hypothetical protein